MPSFSSGLVRFIVNADDLGRSEAINRAILEGIAEGVITSATIMSTGEAFESAAQATKRFPAASFGVHLNLTSDGPLTRNPRLKPLLDPAGGFHRDAVYEARWTKGLVDATVEEWTAQVERARQSGVSVSHLDSHHHVHTIPHLFLALKRVQRNTGIRRVRGTWSIYDKAHQPSVRLGISKKAWWAALRAIYRTRTTSEFTDFLMFRRAVADGSYAPRIWPDSIELMVHPVGDAAVDGEESAALRDDRLSRLPVSAKLMSYNEL